MKSKTLASLAVLLGLVALPAFAQAPNAPHSPLTASTMAPFTRITKGANDADVPGAAKEIANWAGYAVTGIDFSEVQGSWVVPKYHCVQTPNSNSAVFAGIDGYPSTNATMEVIGTASNCVSGKSQYFAWYTLGRAILEIGGFPVKSGDLISASVTYKNGEFFVSISDLTQVWTYSTGAAVSGAKRSSAEWIVARNASLPPLMDFGKVNSGYDYTSVLDSDWATDSTLTGPIGVFGSIVKINMVYGGVTLATPTALTTDRSSFTVNWKHE